MKTIILFSFHFSLCHVLWIHGNTDGNIHAVSFSFQALEEAGVCLLLPLLSPVSLDFFNTSIQLFLWYASSEPSLSDYLFFYW